ncbi:hypothetical protein FX988_00034 [Paraglaciecola mesophila]|uniref:TonB-dependent receptor n=1 Tax=Paraglaciecola mesophila TaxID=197222 RepID=A0A857JDR9_9ALTE|nr:TonB-dependent receptor [Paraglaciecola mesophila]QHJ09826.1 hypothetical protein FX988_00034 [Paraglaciecola mesophila]
MDIFFKSAIATTLTACLLTNIDIARANDELEQITVKGRSTNLIGSAISASEGVVGQEEINLRPLLRTGELMELVPGMVATQHSGSGKANQYFLRGFNLDHGTDFATFVDGMPVNMRTHGHGQGYTDLNFIIPELVETLAYKKGPYFTEVGDFSGAGSAFFSTPNILETGMASLTLGENEYTRLLVADSVQKVANGSLLYAVEKQVYQGPWQDIDEDVSKINGLIKHSQKLNEGILSVTFMAYDNSWNSADQIPQRAVNSGIIDELGSIDTSLGGDSSRYSASTAWDSAHASLTAYFIEYDLNLFSNFTYFLDDPINGDQFEQVDERKVYGAQGHYHFDHKQSRTTVGFETRIDDIQEVGLYKTTERVRRGAVRSDEVTQSSAALYVRNTFDITPKLRTNIGIRYDYFHFDVNSLINRNINAIDLSDNTGTHHDGLVSVKGSITYQINDLFEVYMAAGQGFHSNDARGTTTTVDPNSGESVTPVDALVRSNGAELGLRVDLDDRLNASFSVWQLSLDSELLFVGDAGNTEASRPSKRQGLELTAYYRMTDNLSFDLEYSMTDSEFSDPRPEGAHIPGAIDQVLQMGVSASFSDTGYGSIRARHFGERPLIEDNSVQSDASTVINALLGKRWGAYELKLEVLNVFDSDAHDIDYFYASRLPGEASQGVEDIHYHIIEPRTYRVTVGFRF